MTTGSHLVYITLCTQPIPVKPGQKPVGIPAWRTNAPSLNRHDRCSTCSPSRTSCLIVINHSVWRRHMVYNNNEQTPPRCTSVQETWFTCFATTRRLTADSRMGRRSLSCNPHHHHRDDHLLLTTEYSQSRIQPTTPFVCVNPNQDKGFVL